MSSSGKHTAYNPVPIEVSDDLSISQPPTSSQEKRETSQSGDLYLIRHWRWELFTFALGTGAFVSIIALLFQYHGKAPPILPFGSVRVQLTAVIAALTQVAQSALLVPVASCIGQLKWTWFQRSERVIDLDRFDQASRGPDGSLRLLWHLSWRQRLVSLGALATILMLPFQTFVQQAVHIGDQEITLKNTTYAQIMRSTDIFEDPKAMKSFSTSSSNGTTSSYEMTVGLDAALKRGALGYSIPGLIYSTSASGIYGFCNSPSYSSGNNCSWGPFNTLALCITTTNISSQITKDGSHVSLPALQAFLPNDQDPPSFQSGAHVYVAQGQNASTSMPPTSAADGTNLPSLAEIYYLYYDTCRDGSSSNAALSKSDATRWSAFQGSYQICMQTQSSTTSPTQFSDSTLLSSSTALNWYQTTKYNESAFCTKVEDEADDFCVAESVMQELSRQMGDVFNISAQFDRPDRSDIKYSSEWGPYLADAVLGAPCPDPVATRSRRSWGGGNPYDAPLARFKSSLDGIASSLSDAFRDGYLNDTIHGDVTYAKRILVVSFPWLILPALVYVMAAVLFIATVFTTRRVPFWKSSPLPLLHAMREQGGMGTPAVIEKYAKENSMTLVQTATGWQLIERGAARRETVS